MFLIKYCLQPGLMAGVLALWYFYRDTVWIYPVVVLSVQLLLGALEYKWPARPDWVHDAPDKFMLIAIFISMYVFGGAIAAPIYVETVNPLLSQMRASMGLDFWPDHWPILVQVLLAFFMSEFIWYWFHRAEHRWGWVWRITGHGSHHAFKKLGAIHAGANHPLEILLVLSLPTAIVELLFGAGLAIGGSTLLLLTLAFIAHSNLDLNTKVIGWLFTTNRYHIHHHSAVFEESNTNYGCAAIVWDRVFKTFRDAATVETGIGPTQPSLWEIFIMPYREPKDIETAPVTD